MSWVPFSLLAPLFWASSNFVDKYILGKYTKGIYDFLFFSSITSWVLFLVIISFVGLPQFTSYIWLPLLTGFLTIYSYGFYGKALEKGDTSSLVIFFKLVPVFVVILGFIFLGQTLSAKELFGFVIVLLGAILVSFERNKKILSGGLRMILIAIFMWSVNVLLVDFGLTKMSFWNYFTWDILGSAFSGLTLLILPAMRQEVLSGIKSAGLKKYVWFSGNNVLDFMGHMSIIKALALSQSAAVVSVVAQVQSFYAIVIGVLLTLFLPNLIKEDISKLTLAKKTVGAPVMFLGIYILLI